MNFSKLERLAPVLGIGSYTAPEAARLLKVSAPKIRRWMGGYFYTEDGESRFSSPLWEPQLPKLDNQLEIGFRDLIEVRFVASLIKAGLGLKTIRHCLKDAVAEVNDPRPFSTRRFKTDGRTIFLHSLSAAGPDELLDLRKRQYVIKEVVEQTFKDLDFEGGIVSRWRPFDGKRSIVIDPARAFGQPIVDRFGITTATLAASADAEGSPEGAAWAFQVPVALVRDAISFERQLLAH